VTTEAEESPLLRAVAKKRIGKSAWEAVKIELERVKLKNLPC
jgi:hypothetical protein